MTRWLLLEDLNRFDDAVLLALRLVVGGFLIWGVWDNITSAEHMATFVAFLGKFGFPAPALTAPLSVWVQFACGLAFVLGAFTRWAGLLCAVNFIIAIVMVDRTLGIRGSFASACLVLIGLYLASHGPGRFALDQWLKRRLS
jgi:putative oxidoreductase